MSSFTKDFILNDMERIANGFYNLYPVTKVEPYEEIIQEAQYFGYKFTIEEKSFVARLKYDQVEGNLYKISKNKKWSLIFINKNLEFNEEFDTIGEYMDKVFDLLNE